MHWNHHRQNWTVYRVSNKSVSVGDDLLVKEMDLPFREEPGPWLIEFLRKHDKTKGGSVDPERGSREYLDGMERYDRDHEESIENANDAEVVDVAKDIEKYAVGSRTSYDMGGHQKKCPKNSTRW